MREACRQVGRDYESIEITASLAGGLDHAKRMRDLGVHRLTAFVAMYGNGNPMDGVKRLADEIIAKL